MDEIVLNVRDGIGRVTLNRPHARNALTLAMYDRLHAICCELAGDPAVRVVVFAGSGGDAFAAGTEIAEFDGLRTADDSLRYERGMETLLGAIEQLPMPTIAAIAGACTGGGLMIAAACDVRIAARSARLGLPMARTLGNCLSVRNLARAVEGFGESTVRYMLLSSNLCPALHAYERGFLNELVADADELARRADGLALEIAANAPLTLRATKEALRRMRESGRDAADRDLVLSCYLSNDFREAVRAFGERRAPVWTGT